MTPTEKLEARQLLMLRHLGALTDAVLELSAGTPMFHRVLAEMDQWTEDLDALNAPSQMEAQVLDLYLHWRAHHPTARTKPRPGDVGKLRGRLKEDGLAICKLVVDYIHTAPVAAFWRDNGHLSVGTIFKSEKWGGRADLALDWQKAGYPTRAPADPKQGIDWNSRATNVVEFPR